MAENCALVKLVVIVPVRTPAEVKRAGEGVSASESGSIVSLIGDQTPANICSILCSISSLYRIAIVRFSSRPINQG